MPNDTTAATIEAILLAGLRRHGSADIEDITATTPLAEISFANGDRTLAACEFVAAYESTYGGFLPRHVCDKIVSRLDRGRGTVADLAAAIENWKTRPPRQRRRRLQPGQMCLGL